MDHLLVNLKSYLVHKKTPSKQIRHKKQQNNFQDEGLVTYEEVAEATKYLESQVSIKPTIGIVCGSGLGGLANLIADAKMIDYKDIPHFPVSTVVGHHGALVFGILEGVPVVCMKGRIHAYEGYSLSKCTMPIRVMKQLGCHTVIVTNAAGGLNPEFKVADIMMIKDHIFFPGFAGNNPLRGPNDPRFGGPRFPPMNDCYNRQLMKIAEDASQKLGISQYMHKGVYGMNGGPNFETVAEARFLCLAGCDAAGMSTVHEAIVAHHSGLRVLGFSLITNKIVKEYDSNEKANHEEVLEAARTRSKDFERLIQEIVFQINCMENKN